MRVTMPVEAYNTMSQGLRDELAGLCGNRLEYVQGAPGEVLVQFDLPDGATGTGFLHRANAYYQALPVPVQ